jgi:hypothetical protein
VRYIILLFFWELSVFCKSSLYPVLEKKKLIKKITIFLILSLGEAWPERCPEELHGLLGSEADPDPPEHKHMVRTEFSNPKQTASLRQIARF